MDWKQIIGQLQASGLSQPQIAARCGCGQATISDLASGKTSDPRHSLGQALRELHHEVTGDERRGPAQSARSPTNHPGERATDKPAASAGTDRKTARAQ